MTRKSKKPQEAASFPWDLIGANCLRTVCSSLGWKKAGSKAVMIQFLQAVQTEGLEDALQRDFDEEKSDSSTRESSPVAEPKPSHASMRTRKRRRIEAPEPGDVESPSREPHNTRHRGAKHVRVSYEHIPSASTSQTSVPTRRRGATANATTVAGESASHATQAPKRKRGRPRKHPLPEAQPTPPPDAAPSGGNKIFVGVVIHSRWRAVNGTGHEGVEDEDADGEDVDENDDPIDLMPTASSSSLGSSNKENNPFIPPDPTLELRRTHATIADAINSANAS